jgi:hypothetical protein
MAMQVSLKVPETSWSAYADPIVGAASGVEAASIVEMTLSIDAFDLNSRKAAPE